MSVFHFAIYLSSDSSISLLHEFKTTLHEWRMWDSIKIIRDHHIIKDALSNIFQRSLNEPVRT